MNKYIQAIASNFFYFFVTSIFFIIAMPVSIRIMGAEFYGLWSMLSALMYLLNIGTLGISSIVTKFASESNSTDVLPDQKKPEAIFTAGFTIIMPMATLVCMLMIFSRGFIADHLEVSTILRDQFRLSMLIIGLGVFPQFLAQIPRGYLLSQLHNLQVRKIELFSSIALWMGSIVLVLFIGKNLVWISLWCISINTILLIAFIHSVRKKIDISFYFKWQLIRKMLSFSGYLFIESLAISIFQQLDRIIVGIILGPAAAGVYSVGTSIALRLPMLVGQATEVMLPYSSLQGSVKDNDRLLKILRKLVQSVSLLLGFTTSILIIWMHEILGIWISLEYALKYSNLFRLILVAYCFLSLSRPGHQTLTGIGRVKFTSIIYLLSTIMMLLGVYIFSSRFGLWGAFAANSLMSLLLTYNIYAYYILSERALLRNIINDHFWGSFLPVTMYTVMVFFVSAISFKLFFTALLGAGVLIIIYKDEQVKLWLNAKAAAPKN